MAHETNHETSHNTEKKSKISMSAAFWFVLILAGLFVAATNFVKIESNSSEEEHATEQHHEGAATEEHAATTTEEHGATPATTDTAMHQTAAADTTHPAAH